MLSRNRTFTGAVGAAALLASMTAPIDASVARATHPVVPAPISGQRISLPRYVPMGFGRLARSGFSIGAVIHSSDGGQIFGFDVDHAGDDGLLASAKTTQQGVRAAVETFSQSLGTITHIIARTNTQDDFVTLGIFAGDVGLVEHEHVKGFLQVVRTYHVLNPVTGNAFTGLWTPPEPSRFLTDQVASNQATSTTAVLGTDRNGNPLVFAADFAADTFGRVIALDPNTFGGADQPQLAVDTAKNEAVIATSPDGGEVGGQPPLIAKVDLSTGRITEFTGVVIPPFFSGYVNGLGVDSATGIACTTTELDASVEFYKLSTGVGTDVQLPGSGGNQFFSGEAVVSDALHKLFLVAQPNGSIGPQGDSVVDVYDEKANLVESITGFQAFGVTPELVVNPNTRTGFISGPTPDAITEFTY